MSYLESQALFYEQFPIFVTYVIAGFFSVCILVNLFTNKTFVKAICFIILFVPFIIVSILSSFAKLQVKGTTNNSAKMKRA